MNRGIIATFILSAAVSGCVTLDAYSVGYTENPASNGPLLTSDMTEEDIARLIHGRMPYPVLSILHGIQGRSEALRHQYEHCRAEDIRAGLSRVVPRPDLGRPRYHRESGPCRRRICDLFAEPLTIARVPVRLNLPLPFPPQTPRRRAKRCPSGRHSAWLTSAAPLPSPRREVSLRTADAQRRKKSTRHHRFL